MKWRSLDGSSTEPDARSLREQFAERKDLIERYVPSDVLKVHARVAAELQSNGISDRALGTGALAPGFELPDQQGKLVSSSAMLERGKLVTCFIRWRWCPFCVG